MFCAKLMWSYAMSSGSGIKIGLGGGGGLAGLAGGIAIGGLVAKG